MGYTTTFEGSITITPPLDEKTVEEMNTFFSERHEGPNFPGIWCNWEVSQDGLILYWNGAEKSYAMDLWLGYINRALLMKGHTLDGEMRAYGDEPGDIWMMRVTPANGVERKVANISW